MTDLKSNKKIDKLVDRIWDKGIDGTSVQINKISKKIRTRINKLTRKYYKNKSNMVLNSLIQARINPLIKQIDRIAIKGYDVVLDATNKLMNMQVGVQFTKKELSSLANRRSTFLNDIKFANGAMKTAVKKMLLKNIGGKLTFNQMVDSLRTLYPAYERNAYTIANTALQTMFKDSTFTKYQDLGFEYYKYFGPQDSRNRPYCAARVNMVYTAAEAYEIQSVIMTLYNCRHTIGPITKVQYDQEVGAGFKGPAYNSLSKA